MKNFSLTKNTSPKDLFSRTLGNTQGCVLSKEKENSAASNNNIKNYVHFLNLIAYLRGSPLRARFAYLVFSNSAHVTVVPTASRY